MIYEYSSYSCIYVYSSSFLSDPVDCVVSEWSPWSPCSKTCGYGTNFRNRSVISFPKHGGQPCPVLQETSYCGSLSNCGWSSSKFNSWGNKFKPKKPTIVHDATTGAPPTSATTALDMTEMTQTSEELVASTEIPLQ